MKRVLILAHLGLASPRILGLAKYLNVYGWEATILTPKMTSSQKLKYLFPNTPKVKIVETNDYVMRYGQENIPKRYVNLILKIKNSIKYRLNRYLIKRFTDYPDTQKIWVPHALKKAGQLLKEEKYSIILSSSSPVSYHVLASKLKDLYQIPWIADLRDLWTLNHNYNYSLMRKIMEENLERKTLGNADAMITVSPQWVLKLKDFHKTKHVYLITNGCDELKHSLEYKREKKIVFTYTGRIYPEKQDCSKFLIAISNLIEENYVDSEKIEFNYYGPTKDIIRSIIKKNSIIDHKIWINLYDSVTRKESYIIQRNSDILLLYNWEDSSEKGVVPSKIFEYIGANKPIIATGGYGSDFVSDIISKYNETFYCKNIDQIKITVMRLINYIYVNGVNIKINNDINLYSYTTLSKNLSLILNNYSN